MKRKMTNTQKLLKALESGSKTQAELAKETKVKNVYQIVADLVKRGAVGKVNGLVILNRAKTELPIAADKTDKVTPEKMKEVVEKLTHKPKVVPNEHVDRIAMFKEEIDSITEAVRTLVMVRSYLLKRCQEESSRV